jgi:hypothetical protein
LSRNKWNRSQQLPAFLGEMYSDTQQQLPFRQIQGNLHCMVTGSPDCNPALANAAGVRQSIQINQS